MKKFFLLQSIILLGGTIFSWLTIIADYQRFFAAGGHWLQFSGCIYPNPAVTPCFYGAIAFFIAWIWSILIYASSDDSAAKRQNERWLGLPLAAATIFAWGNFGYEVYKYYRPHVGPYLSCSGTAAASPRHTACFIGSVIFFASLMLNLWIVSKFKNIQKFSQPRE